MSRHDATIYEAFYTTNTIYGLFSFTLSTYAISIPPFGKRKDKMTYVASRQCHLIILPHSGSHRRTKLAPLGIKHTHLHTLDHV